MSGLKKLAAGDVAASDRWLIFPEGGGAETVADRLGEGERGVLLVAAGDKVSAAVAKQLAG